MNGRYKKSIEREERRTERRLEKDWANMERFMWFY